MCMVCGRGDKRVCERCKGRQSFDARVRLQGNGRAVYVNWNDGQQSLSSKSARVWRSPFVTGEVAE